MPGEPCNRRLTIGPFGPNNPYIPAPKLPGEILNRRHCIGPFDINNPYSPAPKPPGETPNRRRLCIGPFGPNNAYIPAANPFPTSFRRHALPCGVPPPSAPPELKSSQPEAHNTGSGDTLAAWKAELEQQRASGQQHQTQRKASQRAGQDDAWRRQLDAKRTEGLQRWREQNREHNRQVPAAESPDEDAQCGPAPHTVSASGVTPAEQLPKAQPGPSASEHARKDSNTPGQQDSGEPSCASPGGITDDESGRSAGKNAAGTPESHPLAAAVVDQAADSAQVLTPPRTRTCGCTVPWESAVLC